MDFNKKNDSKLDLDNEEILTSDDDLRADASQANLDENIESLDNEFRNEKFGQKEYDQAKKDGVYNSNHYKARQQELDKKAEDLNNERHNNTKLTKGETGPIKADGSNTVRKSKMDRVMDNLNYAKAKKDALSNKIDGAKASAYNAMHPIEHAKDAVKSKAKVIAKKAVNNKKVATKAAGKKALSFIAANPYVILILFLVIFIFFIIVFLGGTFNLNTDGYYNQECDFNASVVKLKTCGEEEESSLDIKDYVLGTTYSLVKDKDLNDDAIKAVMIIVKTNALSNGGYDNSSKSLSLDTCSYSYEKIDNSSSIYEKYNTLYTDIEDYLYLSSSYNSTLDTLNSSSSLLLGNNEFELLSEVSGNYLTILNKMYNTTSTDDITYTNNLFIGDSRFRDMMDYGIIDSNKVIYADGLGYDWFVGNGTYNAGVTNALNGAITGVNNNFKENTNYNIIIWLGINDLGNARNYINKYIELAQNDWNNNNLYIVKVGPVSNDASILNTDIDTFNNFIKESIYNSGLSNLKYIDISYDITNFNLDGIHYETEEYSKIYSQIMKNLGNTSNVSSNYKIYDLADYCEFIVIENDGTSNSCESMSISSTSLSRSEFIEKLESYYSLKNDTYSNLFKEKAGVIYDLSVKNGINPEVVVVRAYLEGYSPASQGYSTYNNYWGIGCNNNSSLKNCKKYSSFEDGVLGFINNISKYDSLSSMMSKYAYIGYYWYSPGNAGLGGCYYYQSIKKYLSASRSNEVAAACSKECSGSSCLATVNEDQVAYSKYQVESMAKQRNTIFNITSNYCENYSSNCTIYAQGDSRWGSISLGKSKTNMRSSGCAVTSVAIGISCSGTKLNISDFDPGKFINTLNAGNCFQDDGGIYWGCSAINKIAPNVKLIYSTDRTLGSLSVESKKQTILNYQINNNFILVHFRNDAHKRGHYVVVSEVSGENVITKDPSGGKVTTIPISIIDQFIIYSA